MALAERAGQVVVAGLEVRVRELVPALWATRPLRAPGTPLPTAGAQARGAGVEQVVGVVWAARVAAAWVQVGAVREDALGRVARVG